MLGDLCEHAYALTVCVCVCVALDVGFWLSEMRVYGGAYLLAVCVGAWARAWMYVYHLPATTFLSFSPVGRRCVFFFFFFLFLRKNKGNAYFSETEQRSEKWLIGLFYSWKNCSSRCI